MDQHPMLPHPARLLAISGKRFSGKDTFAAMLVAAAKARGVTLTTYAFATECKQIFVSQQAARGIAVDFLRLLTDRPYKESWRPQLTEFTMDQLQTDQLVFCRAVAERILVSTELPLITDVRLQLEVDYLRSRFDLWLIRIARRDSARAASGWSYTPAVDEHLTETELDATEKWDELVSNDGTLAALEVKASDLIDQYLFPHSSH